MAIIFLLAILVPFLSNSVAAPASATPKQCGLPANLNELPDFAQDELRGVWKDYVPGTKCDKELLITEDILAVLAMFDKELERQQGQGQQQQTKQPPRATHEQNVDEQQLGEELGQLGQAIPLGPPPPPPPPLRNSPSPAPNRGRTVPGSGSSSTTVSPAPTYPAPQNLVEEESSASPSTEDESPQIQSRILPLRASPEEEGIIQRRQKLAAPSKPDKPHRLSKFPAPHDFDYDPITGESFLRSETVLNTDQVRRPSKTKHTDYDAEEEYGAGEEDEEEGLIRHTGKPGGRQQLEQVKRKLPFLRGADQDVLEVFREVLEDPDIPSERRRQEEIHLLAVSYLNARQLEGFNQWSTARRKRLRAREQQLHNLSPPGRRALRRLALAPGVQQQRAALARMPGPLRDELKSWGMSREREERLAETANARGHTGGGEEVDEDQNG